MLALLWPGVLATYANESSQSKSQSTTTTNTIVPPPRRDVPGKRFLLSLGSLYVPDFFDPEMSTGTEVVVFFHGAAWCAEQNFYDARKNAVLVAISVKNYGYPAVFGPPEALRNLLEETTSTLALHNITTKPLSKICLSSFSGGYSAIREILKQREFQPLFSDIVLADSLYAPRVEGTQDKLDPQAMAPFLEFARRAASGECTFWFSHLYPPEERYRTNTTTLAANYLIDHLGAKRQPTAQCNSRGARLLYRADLGDFHVLGYAGMTNQDHLEHFYALSDLLRNTTLTPRYPPVQLAGFETQPFFNEQIRTYIFEPGVRVHINAPGPERFNPDQQTRLILYALPNGNTIEQTIGKKVVEGVDWHFGIQHIGAQTRRLREIIKDQNIVIAYLEAEGKSWPQWREKHPDNGKLIKAVIASITDQLPVTNVTIHLSGHSGGGSFIFGYINAVEHIPDTITRISFLDSDYGYSDEERHGDKIIEWLNRSPHHYLSVICYDDRNIKLNGKLVVGPQGGTYRKTLKMVERIQKDINLTETTDDDLIRYRGMNGHIDIIIHTNPKNLILHTVLVGDMNGFIHAMTSGTSYENIAGIFNGPLAYEKWIQSD
jgi:hypothetical protein